MPPKWLVALILVPILAIVALIAVNGPTGPQSAVGFIVPTPPPAGVLVLVNTPSDLEDPGNGTCSLRAAIEATNINGHAFNCDATGSQAGATDGIIFNIGTGTPTINISTSLPTITDKLAIDGHSPGAADKVELHGPGPGTFDITGLWIYGAGAAGSSIRNLVINNFGDGTGIHLDTTTNITIAGNYIGTNSAGTAAVANATGISLATVSAQIGGLNGLTLGGPCTGDCNLISGNGVGISFSSLASGVIEGNFIGTDVTGMSAIGNGDGILPQGSSPTIGGMAAGAGNLISGNKNGINVQKAAPVVQGNLIGTNVSGTGAIPNVTTGILVNLPNAQGSYPFTIGGSAAGAGNVISGNTGAGIELLQADRITIQGNFIGTQLDGTSALPNGNAGVLLSSSTHLNVMGGPDPGQGNIIAFNGSAGVIVGINNYWNEIRGNSIHDNSGKGISLSDDQTHTTSTPAITGVVPVHGTACANCTIDVYSDADGQGKVYEGTVTADGAGNWTFSGSPAGPNVTATATSTTNSTSEFSAPMTLPATPTPIPSPTPSPTTTATPTPTPSPTPTITLT
jgi:trimeric autotransporter adhesin